VRAVLAASFGVAALLGGACGSITSSSTAPASTTSTSAATTTAPSDQGRGVVVPVAGHPPQDGVPWYLAIGDSITFGYTVDPARAGVNSSWALQLEGLLSNKGKPWKLFDTACPGETTTTYFTGCHDTRNGAFLGGKPQHDVALAAIKAHAKDLKLILIDIGSNDLLRAKAANQTALQAFAVLQTNLNRIIPELQQAAPGVPIVMANYYDPLENADPSTVGQLSLVNGALAQLAMSSHLILADFFAAINTPAAPDPDLGKYVDLAHLDIHPTALGHTRLAQAALAVIPS
jgi:lysophospholipase L1-like esterase